MSNSSDDSSWSMPSEAETKVQTKKGLREFFQQPSIKKLAGILVPSALAAVLFPIFGPAVAGTAASIAIQSADRDCTRGKRSSVGES
jgi:hypothetical protein